MVNGQFTFAFRFACLVAVLGMVSFWMPSYAQSVPGEGVSGEMAAPDLAAPVVVADPASNVGAVVPTSSGGLHGSFFNRLGQAYLQDWKGTYGA